MGNRRIRLCKECGKKFTPKNQKPIPSQGLELIDEDRETEEEVHGGPVL